MTAPATPLLAIRNLRAAYGKIEALRGVDLDINSGEIVALIGANGAGKILFDGRDITEVPTHEIARLRIAQAPEGRRIERARKCCAERAVALDPRRPWRLDPADRA